MRNILLLSASSQGDEVANALKEIIDPDEFAIEVTSELNSSWINSLHALSTRSPLLWRILRIASNTRIGINAIENHTKKVEKAYSGKFDKYLPDIVISLHPLMNGIASFIANECTSKSAAIVVDPFKPVKLSTYDISMVVATHQEAGEIFKKWGIETSILSYPIRQEYITSDNFDAEQIFDSYGLPKRNTILLSAGRFFAIKNNVVTHAYKALNGESNLIILVRSQNEKNKIDEYVKNKDFKNVISVLDSGNLAPIFLISTIHLTTSGTTHFFHSLASQTPLYIYSRINDRYTGIAKNVKDFDLGRVGSLKKILGSLNLSNQEIEKIRENQIQFLRDAHVFTQKEHYKSWLKKIFPE